MKCRGLEPQCGNGAASLGCDEIVFRMRPVMGKHEH